MPRSPHGLATPASVGPIVDATTGHRYRHTSRRQRQMINQGFSNPAEQGVSRWGGLAGIAGGILLVAVFAIVAVFVVAPAPEIAYTILGFADVQAAHMVEEVLYLGVLALWAVHF